MKLTETEFSFNALLASPLDFKNPVFSAKAAIMSRPFISSLFAMVAIGTPSKILKKVSKLLSENIALDQIKSLVNSNNKVDVIFTSGIMDAEHQALPESFDFKKGISEIHKHNDAFVVVNVKDVLPQEQKTLEEAKGTVISDYQNYKEENWLKDLRGKYNVEVNQDVLEKVKSQLKK